LVLGLDGVFYLSTINGVKTMDNNKLTEHELTKRLDGEFSDVDFAYHESPTKGVVATITFYEDKLKDEE
jgi:hypothetical protein